MSEQMYIIIDGVRFVTHSVLAECMSYSDDELDFFLSNNDIDSLLYYSMEDVYDIMSLHDLYMYIKEFCTIFSYNPSSYNIRNFNNTVYVDIHSLCVKEGSNKSIPLVLIILGQYQADISFSFLDKGVFWVSSKYMEIVIDGCSKQFAKSNEEISPYKTYLIKDDLTNLVKIGKSKNPRAREGTLQAQGPKISMIAVLDNDIEKLLHNTYSSLRVRGEWFDLSNDTLLDIINTHSFKVL